MTILEQIRQLLSEMDFIEWFKDVNLVLSLIVKIRMLAGGKKDSRK